MWHFKWLGLLWEFILLAILLHLSLIISLTLRQYSDRSGGSGVQQFPLESRTQLRIMSNSKLHYKILKWNLNVK